MLKSPPGTPVAAFTGTGLLAGRAESHYAVEYPDFSLVVLDSVIAGKDDAGQLGGKQLQWLDATLSRLRCAPALIALHHPPIAVGVPYLDAIRLQDSAALARVVKRHQHVGRILAGTPTGPSRLLLRTPSWQLRRACTGRSNWHCCLAARSASSLSHRPFCLTCPPPTDASPIGHRSFTRPRLSEHSLVIKPPSSLLTGPVPDTVTHSSGIAVADPLTHTAAERAAHPGCSWARRVAGSDTATSAVVAKDMSVVSWVHAVVLRILRVRARTR